jgi:hypothetical protein
MSTATTATMDRSATGAHAGPLSPGAAGRRGLTPGVLRVLDEVSVAPDGLSADVAGQEVTADTPRALRAILANHFYSRYHVGRTEPVDPDEPPVRSLRDPRFEERLAAVMPHRHTTSVVPVLPGGTDPGVRVLLDGVRVTLPEERVESRGTHRAAGQDADGDGSTATGDIARVRLDAARPALSAGFFLCDGSRERRVRTTATLRVYVHLRHADAAPAAWGAVLHALEDEGIPYRAKVASSPAHYPRQDALVVYLGSDGWHAAGRVAEAVRGLDGIGDGTSAYVRRLDRGVGSAWEPMDDRPGMRRVSFGEHRSAAIAAGLTAHVDDPDPLPREEAVRRAMEEAGIDPRDPAHNTLSPRYVLPPLEDLAAGR